MDVAIFSDHENSVAGCIIRKIEGQDDWRCSHVSLLRKFFEVGINLNSNELMVPVAFAPLFEKPVTVSWLEFCCHITIGHVGGSN